MFQDGIRIRVKTDHDEQWDGSDANGPPVNRAGQTRVGRLPSIARAETDALVPKRCEFYHRKTRTFLGNPRLTYPWHEDS